MKKESFYFPIKSGYLTMQNLESILELFSVLAEEDNKIDKTYKHELRLSFGLTNGYKCLEDDRNDFLKKLKESKINLLKSLDFTYYGNETDLNLNYSRNFYDNIDLKIETTDKKNYAYYKEAIIQLVGSGNWNWIFHSMPVLITIYILASVLLILFIKLSFYRFQNLPLYWFYIPYFLWLAVTYWPAKIYPKLILDLEKQKFGRSFKTDFWKIIGAIIALAVIPILLKRIGWL